MIELIGGILGDCLDAKGVAVSGTITGVVSTAIGKMMAKRHKMLQEIVLSELRQGNFENVDQDELVAIFFRLIRDAEEGVARNNLRLMARVINGMAEKKELKAPSFLKYANILASLTEDEIAVLAIMMKNAKKEHNTLFDGLQKSDPLLTVDPGKSELKKKIPEYKSIQQALLRTGLIIMDVVAKTEQEKRANTGRLMYASGKKEPDFDVSTKAYNTFRLTPLMCELSKYIVDFDETNA